MNTPTFKKIELCARSASPEPHVKIKKSLTLGGKKAEIRFLLKNRKKIGFFISTYGITVCM